MEEFYELKIDLHYADSDLNQQWSDSVLEHICEGSLVSIECDGSKPLDMRLAKPEFGICATKNSPTLKVYVYADVEGLKEIKARVAAEIQRAANRINIPYNEVSDLQQYIHFSKIQLETTDPILPSLWKIDNERKKSEK